ncbi:uncharacterized protein METZ01_LOCUS397125, partial [marine metagenome]
MPKYGNLKAVSKYDYASLCTEHPSVTPRSRRRHWQVRSDGSVIFIVALPL